MADKKPAQQAEVAFSEVRKQEAQPHHLSEVVKPQEVEEAVASLEVAKDQPWGLKVSKHNNLYE